MKIDIRDEKEEKITKIVFGDGRDEIGCYGAECLYLKSWGVSLNNEHILTTDIDNLIKALQKAKELLK